MIYKDIILEHFRNPQNYGVLKRSDSSVLVYNPLCGDKIRIDVLFDQDKIEKISFTGEGCAISMASASLLTQYAIGKTKKKIIELDRNFMVKFVGISPTPTRLKCLLLPLEALQKNLIPKS